MGGHVERSLLGPGVAIAGEAFVRDSILFHDACVERGATLTRVIVAGSVEIGDDAIVGAACDEVTKSFVRGPWDSQLPISIPFFHVS